MIERFSFVRTVVLCVAGLSVIAIASALWDSPQSAQRRNDLKVPDKFSVADDITGVIRDPSVRYYTLRTDNSADRRHAERFGRIVADNDSLITVAVPAASIVPSSWQRMDTRVNLPGASFDPLVSLREGTIRPGEKSFGTDAGYYVVQLGVTPTDELLDSLKATGVEILQYVPHQAFFVYGPAQAMESVASHSRVRWVGRYRSEAKPSLVLREQLAGFRRGRAPGKGITGLQRTGRNTAVFDVSVFSNADLMGSASSIAIRTGGRIRNLIELPSNFFNVVRIEGSIDRIESAADVDAVFSIESWSTPRREDEIASHIVAGNYVGNTVAPPGFNPLTQFGVNGLNTTIGVVDDGVGIPGDGGFYVTASNAVNGPLRGATTGAEGHGHLQASIIAGDSPFSSLDLNGYNYGSGLAPKANIVNIPLLRTGYTGTEADTANDVVTTVGPNGVPGFISNNSWGFGTNGNSYDSYAAQFDGFVRDASTAGTIDPLMMVFSAGNSGTSGLTRPKVAKNILAVAATENVRPDLNSSGGVGAADNLEQLPNFSSRGPAADSRVKPDISAPGDAITGGRSGTDALFGNIDTFHRVSSGTSHAAPLVAGAAALFTEYWKNTHAGSNPSPAMVKAALINGTVDVTGSGATAARPNGSEGWGRINLKNVLNTGATISYFDQDSVLSDVGQIRNYTGAVPDSGRPVRISLVWTDPPGSTDPALVNDLDLEVLVDGKKYLGNAMNLGSSVIGGASDNRNNVENVFLPSGISGPISIRVIARALNGDGVLGNADTTDQHFAIVVFNGSVAPSSLASPEGGTPNILLGNNLIEPSECNLVSIPVTNLGASTATSVTATLSTTSPGVSVTVANASYPNIAPGATASSSSPFQVSTDNTVACASNVDLVLTVSYAGMVVPSVSYYSLRVGIPPAENYAFSTSTGATISAGGALVPGSSADDAIIDFASPFDFSVYETAVPSGSTLRLSTNGQIRIETVGSTGAALTNAALPSSGGSGSPFPASLPVLLPYWDDLDLRTTTTTGGGIYTEVTGSPGSRTLKIEWRARNYLAGQPLASPSVQFAVYFHENSNDFEYVYALTGSSGIFASGSSATVGVQGASTGTTYTQFSFNSPSLSPGLQISATRGPGVCSPGFGPCVSTAARVEISGRVLDQFGRGVANVRLQLQGGAGSSFTATSNTFGYFRFTGAEVGQGYVLTAAVRGMSISPTFFDLNGPLTDITLIAQR